MPSMRTYSDFHLVVKFPWGEPAPPYVLLTCLLPNPSPTLQVALVLGDV